MRRDRPLWFPGFASRLTPHALRGGRVAVAVAQADDGLDALVAELAAERPDVDVHRARLDVGIVIPEAREDRVGVFVEVGTAGSAR